MKKNALKWECSSIHGMMSKKNSNSTPLLLGGLVLIIGAALLIVFSSMNNPMGPIACTLDAKICPDGSAVGRTGPNCEFEECPSAPASTPGKLLSHESLANLAGCEEEEMFFVYEKEHPAWNCANLPSGYTGTFEQNIPYYSDRYAYGFDFSALTYKVPYIFDQEIESIYKECLQICIGTRLMAYIDGEWNSIDSVEELRRLTGTIDSEAEALAFARYATGQPAGDEILLEGQETEVEVNAQGNYEVNLYTHEGGICCGTDYVYYKVTYEVTKEGNVSEKGKVEVGIVENNAIA